MYQLRLSHIFLYFQIQGINEHFTDNCGGVIGWLGSITGYTAFTEGWALYAENPLIARDTDTYKDNLLQKYGMLKWQVCRPGYSAETTGEALDTCSPVGYISTDFLSSPGVARAAPYSGHRPPLQRILAPESARLLRGLRVGHERWRRKGSDAIPERPGTSDCVHDWPTSNNEATRLRQGKTRREIRLERFPFLPAGPKLGTAGLHRGQHPQIRELYPRRRGGGVRRRLGSNWRREESATRVQRRHRRHRVRTAGKTPPWGLHVETCILLENYFSLAQDFE